MSGSIPGSAGILDTVDALWVTYHDYAGIGRAKAVPRARFADVLERGVTFALANWDLAVNDHQVPHPVFGADSGDFRVVPDPTTIVPIPYRSRVAQALGWLVDESGAPWVGDPRGRLAEQVEALAGLGYTARVSFEAEFLLANAGETGWRPADHGRMFTVDAIEARWSYCAAVLDALAEMGIAVHQLAKEYGPGQYEISLLPSDPVQAADSFLLARQVIKALARDAGMTATFMPKPFAELPGNGLHVHLSLQDSTGREVLADLANDDRLSDVGTAAVSGLLAHARGQAALGAPTPNSYKRLLPGSWAPAHICWAFGNRAALVRIPGRGSGRRFEYRSGDAAANPYLHLAGLLAAIIDGIDRRLPAVPAATGDVGHWSDEEALSHGIARLPTSLNEALGAFAEDEVLGAAVGSLIREHYLAVKSFELDSYRAEIGSAHDTTDVTEWERTVYLELL